MLGESPSGRQYQELNLQPARSTIAEKWGWNYIKKKANLEQFNAGDRNNSQIKDKPESVEMSSSEWSELSPHMRWYYRNQEEAKSKANKRRRKRIERIGEKIDKLKQQVGCQSCGFDKHHSALDFHHLRDKEQTISSMLSSGVSRKKYRKRLINVRYSVQTATECITTTKSTKT